MDIITYALCKKADKEIIDMIHDMEGMTVEIVDEVPTVQEAQYNVMYLVDTNGDGKYEAYIKAKISGIDQIISLGSIIDLSDFYTKSEIDTALAGKQPLLTWDNVPTSGSNNAISSGAIYTALDKIKTEEISDVKYAALVTKDPDKVYFVYEVEEDNRSIVCKDSNGNWKYTTTIIGTTASDVTGNVTAEESTVTTPPTPGFDYWYGNVVFRTETSEETVYHSMFYFSNDGKSGMRDTASGDGAPDAYFELGTNGSITYHPTPSGSPVGGLYVFSSSHRDSDDTIEFAITPKPNGFKRIYKGDKLYATTELPVANNITYDNTNSGLTATTTQDAIDELNINDVGKKEYVNDTLKGEIFNTYSGNGKNIATGDNSHAEGYYTQATGQYSHAEGYANEATALNAHAEGNNTIASGEHSHTEGFMTEASGISSHAEGSNTSARAENAHTEGQLTTVYSESGHAEGKNTKVGSVVVNQETGTTTYTGPNATYAHAEGYGSLAAANCAHAEGYGTQATGIDSHAEGYATQARGDGSHSEGYATIAAGGNSHAEGHTTLAQGLNSHAGGFHTQANTNDSTVIGRYNVADGTGSSDPKHLFIIGNGTENNLRSNILEVSDSYLNLNGILKINNTAIGSLAMKSSATDSYTPAGTVSTPTISATTTSATVNSITAVGTLPTLTYDAVNKEYTFSQGTLPTKGDNVTVIASIDSLTSTQPTFTGTTATIEVT